MFVFFLVYWI